ncbi:hypothetical protein Taro_033447 [Colocasia esculenta]|uniref:Uncharacterized protein n=1 Tax=Colocasia esculenta TaxID=4460 RepID=A0A843W914_COLES|nr:hypothetical protein [Colocasia esculenta]
MKRVATGLPGQKARMRRRYCRIQNSTSRGVATGLRISASHPSDLTFSMAPKGKRLVSRRHPTSSALGEGSEAPAERRSKHRDDRLPELLVPPNRQTYKVRGSFTKFVQPRFVEFESLEDMFPSLQPLFDTQGWMTFLYSHKRYSPVAVTEFYNNLELSVQGDELFTTVKGANVLVNPPYASDYYTLITHQIYHPSVDHLKLNANSFPPLNRLIHHIFTTLVVPKDGSRELITTVHNSFDLIAIHRIGYKLLDGRVIRTLKGQTPEVAPESDEDAEGDDDDEDSQVEPMDAQGDDDDAAEDQATQGPTPSL